MILSVHRNKDGEAAAHSHTVDVGMGDFDQEVSVLTLTDVG